MVAAGRASLELGGKIAEKLGVQLTDAGSRRSPTARSTAATRSRSAGPTSSSSSRSAAPSARGSPSTTRSDGAAPDGGRGQARLGAPHHRRDPLVRLLAPGQEVGARASPSPRASSRRCSRPGIDRLVTMDLHAGQMQGFFSKPVDHMTAMPILTQFVKDQLGDEDLVIIAPDAGRVKLVRKFAQKVGAPYALHGEGAPGPAGGGDRLRDRRRQGQDRRDRRRHHRHRRHALGAAAQTVLDEGANKVYAVATHGLFSGNAFETLESSPLAGIVVTDTVPLREGAPDLIRQLTCADILTDSIGGSSPTTPCRRSSRARTSCSSVHGLLQSGCAGDWLLGEPGCHRADRPARRRQGHVVVAVRVGRLDRTRGHAARSQAGAVTGTGGNVTPRVGSAEGGGVPLGASPFAQTRGGERSGNSSPNASWRCCSPPGRAPLRQGVPAGGRLRRAATGSASAAGSSGDGTATTSCSAGAAGRNHVGPQPVDGTYAAGASTTDARLAPRPELDRLRCEGACAQSWLPRTAGAPARCRCGSSRRRGGGCGCLEAPAPHRSQATRRAPQATRADRSRAEAAAAPLPEKRCPQASSPRRIPAVPPLAVWAA